MTKQEGREMVKIYMTSGAILYRGDNWKQFRAYINAANARGAAVITAYRDVELNQPVQLQLQNVEIFEPVDPVTDPIV